MEQLQPKCVTGLQKLVLKAAGNLTKVKVMPKIWSVRGVDRGVLS